MLTDFSKNSSRIPKIFYLPKTNERKIPLHPIFRRIQLAYTSLCQVPWQYTILQISAKNLEIVTSATIMLIVIVILITVFVKVLTKNLSSPITPP